MKGHKRLALLLFAIFIVGCATPQATSSTKVEGKYGKEIQERELHVPRCAQPIATIVAKGFKCKAAQCRGDRLVFGPRYTIELSPQALGDGLADMLVTALVQTGCFNVLEREALEEVKEELEMLGEKPTTLKGADLLLTGAITSLELNAGGMGGGGLLIPLPWKIGGGVKVGKSNAQIGLDMRIISVRDAKIISAKSVEGKSERWKFGVGGGGLIGSVVAGGWFEAFKNTPLEEATRDLLAHAVTLIVQDVSSYAATHPLTPQQPQPAATPQVERPRRAEPSGGLRRMAVAYAPGNTTVWEEDFSRCEVVPMGWKMAKGSAECVEFRGKRWIAGLKGETLVKKDVPEWDPSKDWALEFSLYISGRYFGDILKVAIGKEDSPYSLTISGGEDRSLWSDKPLPDIPRPAAKEIHHVAIQKKGSMFFIFFDGKRIFATPAEAVSLSHLPRSFLFLLGGSGSDISTGKYVLITDLRLTHY